MIPLLLSMGALLCGYGAMANAATFVSSGHVAGPQCATAGVNDSGQLVGNCKSADPSANSNPWFASTGAGPQQVLPPLMAGQRCSVAAIANNGSILGGCSNASGLSFASLWSASAPTNVPIALAPLPARVLIILPFRAADVQTFPTALNQHGAVLAESISASLDATVVLYTAGSSTPQRVSNWGDNCVGVDLTETPTSTSTPGILMNCPGPFGTNEATVAKWNGSGFTLTKAPIPAAAVYCAAADINDSSQFVGSCLITGTTSTGFQTAVWSSATATPLLLSLPGGAQNSAVAINNLGHVLAYGNDADTSVAAGIAIPFFWPDPTSSFSVQPIQPLPGSLQISPAGFAENDTVAMNCQDTSQYVTACYWTPSGGSVTLPAFSDGLKSRLNGISPAGGIVFGAATDSAKNQNAVSATLP